MDSGKFNFWEKSTGYNQTVYTFQVIDGADIRILLQFDEVPRFEVEINDKLLRRLFSTFVGFLLVYAITILYSITFYGYL